MTIPFWNLWRAREAAAPPPPQAQPTAPVDPALELRDDDLEEVAGGLERVYLYHDSAHAGSDFQ